MRFVIGITGKARAGKDTVAKILLEMFPGATKYAFADPLKEGLKVALGLTDEEVHGELKDTMNELYGKTNREMLQTFGTDWGREMVNQDIWLLAATRKMPKGLVIVSDVRFENEAKFVRENGVLLHILRNGLPEIKGVNGHTSEDGIELKPEDRMVFNDFSLKTLKDRVHGMFEEMLPPKLCQHDKDILTSTFNPLRVKAPDVFGQLLAEMIEGSLRNRSTDN